MQFDDTPLKASPLSVAADEKTRDAILLVRDALRDRRAMLAFQPVVQARMP